MEDNKIKKLNIPAADLPEVPRTTEGKIDLEAITIETDEKNNKIIPMIYLIVIIESCQTEL